MRPSGVTPTQTCVQSVSNPTPDKMEKMSRGPYIIHLNIAQMAVSLYFGVEEAMSHLVATWRSFKEP